MAIGCGTRLGPYEIVEEIGTGGMGAVFRARDTRLGRSVAIKVLLAKLSFEPEVQQRFAREAQMVSKLSHPNICTLLDVGEEEGTDFLVMEYLEGETLSERIARGPIPVEEVLDIGAQVAAALDKAHREGVLHRDLKPGNVMLTESGAKLLDFGLGKIVLKTLDDRENELANADTERRSLGQTTAGTVVGTIYYMSPEQLREEELDGRADVWSLGVVLYQMTTGRLPFRARTAVDVAALVLSSEPDALTDGGVDVPERLGEIVGRAMAKDRDARYASARELRADLKHLARKLEIQNEVEKLASKPAEVAPSARVEPVSGEPPSASSSAGAASARARELGPTAAAVGLGAVTVAATAVSLPAGVAVGVASALAAAVYGLSRRTDSLAVLPFVWASANGQSLSDPDREYLSDGLTESIINSLARFDNLRVVSGASSFRYKGKDVDPRAVGSELGVRKIVTGRLHQRRETLSVHVELVDAGQNKHIWGEQYERDVSSLVAIPREIAGEISRNLSARWSRGEVHPKAYPDNSEAYQAYLKGRFFWNKRTGDDIRKAIEHFEEAIRSDPSYAPAHVGVAESYLILGVYSTIPLKDAYQQAKVAASRALEIDPSSAEAHAAMAMVTAGADWDLPGALTLFARALELKPSYPTAHQWYAEHLVCADRFEEALREMDRALELDPLSRAITSAKGLVLMQSRRYEEALAQLRRALAMDEQFYLAHRLLHDTYVSMGRFDDAIDAYGTAAALAGEPSESIETRSDSLRRDYESDGEHGYWRTRLRFAIEDLDRASSAPYGLADTSPYQLAIIYARLGEDELAVKWLERAYDESDYGLFYLRTNPVFDALRRSPKVVALMRRIGVSS